MHTIQEKTSFYSVFDNSCYPDNNANHMLLTSDLNSSVIVLTGNIIFVSIYIPLFSIQSTIKNNFSLSETLNNDLFTWKINIYHHLWSKPPWMSLYGIMCIIQHISRGPSKRALHTQLVIMLKHWVFFLIKNEYYFVSNPSNYTVKSNFLFSLRGFFLAL